MAAKYEVGFEQHRRPTRRDEFLDAMSRTVPWADLCAAIDPRYTERGNGCPPIGLERMLRIYFIQHWFNLANFACEEAFCDISSLRHFAGLDTSLLEKRANVYGAVNNRYHER
jgi:IS5 family transposase